MISRGLANLGCNVIVHSRVKEQTAELRAALDEKVHSFGIAADLSDVTAIDAMIEEAQRISGGIDILYNNAAIVSARRERFVETPLGDFLACFDVNVIVPIHITYGLLPRKLERRWGRIVQLTSGIRDQPDLMPYAISKAALDKFVCDSAIALRGTGVLMNLLDPGWIRTRLGGPNAPCSVESVLPGALVPALLDGEVHGVLFCAQDYTPKA